MNFLELAADRYSVRKYSDRPIEEEKLAKILEAGHLAPTACNDQPQKIYVLKSKEALEKAKSVCKYTFGAPVILLVCYDEETVWKNPLQPGYNSGEVDSSIVATHMMMEAWELGIGSCWVGYFNAGQVAAAFDLPQNEKPVLFLPIGYAAEDAKCSPLHKKFRPMEETVVTL